jgi:hypothetical protein
MCGEIIGYRRMMIFQKFVSCVPCSLRISVIRNTLPIEVKHAITIRLHWNDLCFVLKIIIIYSRCMY